MAVSLPVVKHFPSHQIHRPPPPPFETKNTKVKHRVSHAYCIQLIPSRPGLRQNRHSLVPYSPHPKHSPIGHTNARPRS